MQANLQYNLTAVRNREEIYLRHFADSLMPLSVTDLDLFKRKAISMIDIGSGAGLPGLALAVARGGWSVTSLEATGKKVCFQQQVVDALDLANVRVIQGRAEEVAHEAIYRERFHLVTARAVASLTALVEIGLPFLRPNGLLLVWKGPAVEKEIDQAGHALDLLHGELEQVVEYNLREPASWLDVPVNEDYPDFNLVMIRKTSSLSSQKYPRNYNLIKNQPL